ncbi:MAG TPA: hypothetical protein VEK57_22555 [Thermoanaerobaculia bacterium]|nr:hypothetical protein [Thermoanaerobaculia bacterium]
MGATLLLLCIAGCDRFLPREKRVVDPSAVEIEISTPYYRGSYPYPEPIPILVTIHNGGATRQNLELGRPRRGGCNPAAPIPAQREPVELLFAGSGSPESTGRIEPYVWRWRAPSPAPRRLVLEPGQSLVLIDTTFSPPSGYVHLSGDLCVRVYDWEIPSGIGVRLPDL